MARTPTVTRSIASVLLSVLLAGTVSGCVQDHTVDQWRREKLQEELDQLAPIEGTYRGMLRKGEAELGALELSFTPRIGVVPGGPSEKAEGQPVLTARVIFQDLEGRIALTSQDSFFEPDSGRFEIDLQLARASGRTERVVLGGVLSKGVLAGTLEASGNFENRADFTLNRAEKTPLDEIASKISPKPWAPVPGNLIEGITEFSDGQSTPARLVVLEPEVGPEEAFLNRFAPIRVVQLSISYGDAFRLVHEGALWDERTRRLVGRTRLQELEISTQCSASDRGGKGEWSCSHEVAGFGRTAVSRFPVEGAVDDGSRRNGFRFRRQGELALPGGRAPQRVWLQVTRPANTRAEELSELFIPSPERKVTASLQFGPEGAAPEELVTVVFDGARVDLRAKTLDATAQLRAVGAGSGSIIEVRLQCTDFVLPALAQPGTPVPEMGCSYTSTQLGGALGLRFPAP